MEKYNKQRLFEMMNRVGGMKRLTKEEFLNSLCGSEHNLDEIDWKETFGDVGKTCMHPNQVVKWLNDELNRLSTNREYNRRKKDGEEVGDLKVVPPPKKGIIMSQGNIEKLIDSTGDINIDTFIKNLIKEPSTVFDKNPKMEKSDVGRKQLTINTGLPALEAIVYDVDEENFYTINTCPGAGTCLVGCYGREGFYRMSDSKIMRLTRRINLLLNYPERYEERAYAEILVKANKMPKEYKLIIRWNDAGDFLGRKYLEIAKNTTKRLLDDGFDVKSYAYTKVGDYVMELDDDENFTINFSTDAKKSERDKIKDYSKASDVKLSHRVPKYREEDVPYKRKEGVKKVKVPLWAHFFERRGPHYVKDETGKPKFATPTSKDDLKQYVVDNFGTEFNLNINNLKYTWELPYNDEGGRKYDVIVLPTGDSDIAAQREDVRTSFLLEH